MKEYTGAVLFVDVLGISALTTSEKLLVTDNDFEALPTGPKKVGGNQLFCARLLSQFRSNLHECKMNDLKIAQLSDCAFLWSKNESLVVQAARKIFLKNTNTGIFARGGMTFGQIIEPDKTRRSLGQFGPVTLWCRSGFSFTRPEPRRPRGFSSPGLSVCGADCRSR